jgi:hypothetical protein
MVRITPLSGIWKPMAEVFGAKLHGRRHQFYDAIDRIFSERPRPVCVPIGEAKPLLDWLTSEYPESVTWEIIS